jgi:hypothetical protein
MSKKRCDQHSGFLLSFSNATGKRSDNDSGNLALVSRSPARLAQSLGLFFYSLLKCLKRFIALLPDAAARIANDEWGGVCIKRA